MTLTNMKMSAEEAREYATCDAGSEREYPYGLEISLDDEGLAKLGMTAPPAVGTEMIITAKVVVTSASQYQRQGNEPEMSTCWQITDMEVSGSPIAGKAAQSLYGGNND